MKLFNLMILSLICTSCVAMQEPARSQYLFQLNQEFTTNEKANEHDVIVAIEKYNTAGDKQKVQDLIDLAVLNRWLQAITRGLQLGYDASDKVKGEEIYQSALTAEKATK